MTVSPCMKQPRRAACAGTLVLLALITWGSGYASAQTDPASADDPDNLENHVLNTDKKIFNGLLGVFGLGSSEGDMITYRERSPLVVPPQRNLPPPERRALAKNPEWPLDPEVKLRREEAAALKNTGPVDFSKPLAGTSAMGPKVAAGSRGTVAPGGNEDPGATSKKPDVDFFRMLTRGKLWGTPVEEVGTFTSEPPRNSLTEPPPGYLTPSPSEPYGVTKRTYEMPKQEKPL